MNGVEILSSAEVASEFAFNNTAFLIAFGAILAIFVAVGIWLAKEEYCWEPFLTFGFIGVILAALFGLLIGNAVATPIAYETQYKVIIDDSVSMNEFLDKYEIIDQEGKIYTVREKE